VRNLSPRLFAILALVYAALPLSLGGKMALTAKLHRLEQIWDGLQTRELEN